MPTKLQKNHVVVHTGSINVKIMRLDKRQITLSVFRQIDQETIFVVDGTLRGIPWGRVNYTWNENRPGTEFHVVWQDNDYLKVCPIPSNQWIGEGGSRWLDWVIENDFGLKEQFGQSPPGGSAALSVVKWCRDSVKQLQEKLADEDYDAEELIIDEWNIARQKKLIAQLLREYPSGNFRDEDTAHRYWKFSCGDLLGFISYLQNRQEDFQHAAQAHEAELTDWKNSLALYKEKFLRQVAAMKKLDQLFIAT